eukprot:1148001-Pelagomonas_calceolata.AAC.3
MLAGATGQQDGFARTSKEEKEREMKKGKEREGREVQEKEKGKQEGASEIEEVIAELHLFFSCGVLVFATGGTNTDIYTLVPAMRVAVRGCKDPAHAHQSCVHSAGQLSQAMCENEELMPRCKLSVLSG